MGSFGGHALPGTFFILFGLWYIIQAYRRYFQCRESGARFKSSMTFSCPCLCARARNWPSEAIFKISCCCIGFIVEIIGGISNGRFTSVGNGQHATMFFFFGLSGLIDILMHHKMPLPPSTDYISFAMALAVEGLLFKFHLYGRTPLDVLLHTLLVLVIMAGIASVLVEIRFKNNVLCPLARGYTLVLQGTWFWQVGNILYPPLEPKWDEHDHELMMIATLYFTWHAGAVFITVLLIGSVIACRYKNRLGYCGNGIDSKGIENPDIKHTVLNNLDDDSASDGETTKQ